MKPLIALFLSLLLLLQAIPVAALLCDDVPVSMIDEDKPEETKGKVKKAGIEFLCCPAPFHAPAAKRLPIVAENLGTALPCPYLEKFTPPPNC